MNNSMTWGELKELLRHFNTDQLRDPVIIRMAGYEKDRYCKRDLGIVLTWDMRDEQMCLKVGEET